MQEKLHIIAKTFKGLEEVLAKELIELGANDIQIERRAVRCTGDKTFLYKANLCSRTASRFLVTISEFRAKNPDELYEQVKKINWENHLDLKSTFSVQSTIYSDTFTHSKFVSYRVKDAIVDYFMDKFQKRPSVSVTAPALTVHIHISQNRCSLALDSSGESLHKRGYRSSQTEAPINEALAAGMLLLAGWDGKSNFVDPMCGSGTLLIEAALIALNIPPGIYRKSFGFEKWKDFDKDLFDNLYNDDSYERDFHFKISGSDISSKAIQIAEQNIKSAGLGKYIELTNCPITEINLPQGKCLMVTNPPYGERLKSEDLFGLYETIGRTLKHKFSGSDAWLISSDEYCLQRIGLKPSEKFDLLNGELECKFCHYEIFDGKRNDFLKKQ